MASPADIKDFALRRAGELGFCRAGVAPVEQSPHFAAFADWLAAGRHATMDYLARYGELRRDVRAVAPWARSVLCLAARYADAAAPDGPVARYARGRDYHEVLKRLCRRLADELRDLAGGKLRTRVCVDTAPLLERDWAWRAGLGWIGQNTCLIVPGAGSYVVLAEILLDAALPADAPADGDCGQCGRCRQACPTGALVAPRTLDARRCINWATIEHRGELDGDDLALAGQVYGCDICQQACPHNAAAGGPAPLAELAEAGPRAGIDAPAVLKWTPRDYDAATAGSAARRAGYAMFLRNACVVAGQQRLTAALDDLRRLAQHEDPIVTRAAGWALQSLGG